MTQHRAIIMYEKKEADEKMQSCTVLQEQKKMASNFASHLNENGVEYTLLLR